MVSTPKFFFDEEVRDQIFQIIKEAKQEIYLVSPYNKHPNQLENALNDAIQRDVRVTMIYRDDKDQHEGVRPLKNKATVLSAKWLHAKIYMNESTALATSMNLLDSSFNNSLEFGFRVDKAPHGALYRQLAEYVERLQRRAEQSNDAVAAPEKSSPAKAATKHAAACIRCGGALAFNPEKPYCRKDFKSWNGDPDYPEKHCHACGREWATSMNKPVCLTCYRRLTR